MNEVSAVCPECASEHFYEIGELLACSMCAHEWNPEEAGTAAAGEVVRDAVGNILSDGDDVTVIRDLRVKGSQGGIKAGTKVRGIRLVEPVDDHDIDCRIDGFGRMRLKSSVVKKA
jgi:protein PhnA